MNVASRQQSVKDKRFNEGCITGFTTVLPTVPCDCSVRRTDYTVQYCTTVQ